MCFFFFFDVGLAIDAYLYAVQGLKLPPVQQSSTSGYQPQGVSMVQVRLTLVAMLVDHYAARADQALLDRCLLALSCRARMDLSPLQLIW